MLYEMDGNMMAAKQAFELVSSSLHIMGHDQ